MRRPRAAREWRSVLLLLLLAAAGPGHAACLATLRPTVQLAWDAPAPAGWFTLTGYTLEQQTDSGAFVPFPPLPATAGTFTAAGLPPGHTYTYRLKDQGTVNGVAGESDYAPERPCVQVLLLPVPQNLKATPQ